MSNPLLEPTPAQQDVTLPQPPKERGRPSQAETVLKYEEYHKQHLILTAIQSKSEKSPAVLEKALGIDVSPNNAGKAWRSWAKGQRRCGNLAAIVRKAREQGWVSAETEELFRYIDTKKRAQQHTANRKAHFEKLQRELQEALRAFRAACEQAHNTHPVDVPLPALSIRCHNDPERFTSIPLNGDELEGLFARAEESVYALARLELTANVPLETDPQTGRAFNFNPKTFAEKPPLA